MANDWKRGESLEFNFNPKKNMERKFKVSHFIIRISCKKNCSSAIRKGAVLYVEHVIKLSTLECTEKTKESIMFHVN